MGKLLGSVIAVFCLVGSGCGDDGPSATVERGQLPAKADFFAGSCEGACGEQATNGPCWCDDTCIEFGDCCVDKVATCSPDLCPGLTPNQCSDTPGCQATIVPIACDCAPTSPDCICPLGGQMSCVPCTPVTCELFCADGFAINDTGCEICACAAPPTCAERDAETCESAGNCELRIIPVPCDCAPDDVGCFCPQGGQQQCGETCEPVLCELFCEHGFATDTSGCAVCSCNEPPTPTACSDLDTSECDSVSGCGLGIVPIPCACASDDPDCFCPLGGQLQCQDACSPVHCELYCEAGFETNDAGCSICKCKEVEPSGCANVPVDLCDDVDGCEVGIVPIPCDCTPGDADCACPLGGQLQCGPACSPILCSLFCENGFETDASGCGICSCAELPADCSGLAIDECELEPDCAVGIMPVPCDCAPDDTDCYCPLGGQQFCYEK